MWAVAVVMSEVLAEDGLKLATAEDEEAIQTLAPHGPDSSLADGVGLRRADRDADYLDALRTKDGIEARRELGISIPDQEPEP
jgi:hypothetical protein